MKFEYSRLELLDFNILNSKSSFEQPGNSDSIVVPDITSKYKLDLDFVTNQVGENMYFIFAKISINEGEDRTPGHIVFAESLTVFRLNGNLTEDEKSNLINFSAVSIAFNNLRGFVANLTSYSPMGSYYFPIFDVQALLKSKQEHIQLKKEKQKQIKRKSKSTKNKS